MRELGGAHSALCIVLHHHSFTDSCSADRSRAWHPGLQISAAAPTAKSRVKMVTPRGMSTYSASSASLLLPLLQWQ